MNILEKLKNTHTKNSQKLLLINCQIDMALLNFLFVEYFLRIALQYFLECNLCEIKKKVVKNIERQLKNVFRNYYQILYQNSPILNKPYHMPYEYLSANICAHQLKCFQIHFLNTKRIELDSIELCQPNGVITPICFFYTC